MFQVKVTDVNTHRESHFKFDRFLTNCETFKKAILSRTAVILVFLAIAVVNFGAQKLDDIKTPAIIREMILEKKPEVERGKEPDDE